VSHIEEPTRSETVRRALFPASRQSARDARGFVRGVLEEWRLDALAEPAALLTSEIVTNAVVHTGSALVVNVERSDHVLRVDVEDHDPTLPARVPADHDAEHGRGLHIVNSMASRWGATAYGTGKRVWFEIPVIPQQTDTSFFS
jgi:anti-sigma regulatory factor (Ser/Thr protein kinase)